MDAVQEVDSLIGMVRTLLCNREGYNKSKFDSLIEELKNTVSRFNSNPIFDQDFDAKIAEVEAVYESLLKSIEILLNKKKS